jgi:hypothetical protein
MLTIYVSSLPLQTSHLVPSISRPILLSAQHFSPHFSLLKLPSSPDFLYFLKIAYIFNLFQHPCI